MRSGTLKTAKIATLSLLLVALWTLTHRYAGLTHDARVYAFQALSRLHPNLRTDLYLQNTSQDQFTIFSPFYAAFIDRIGLENSALLLTMIFTLWFMAAAWTTAKQIGGHDLAWLSLAVIILTAGDYGAFGVFHFPEAYLSARLPAYALVATALALHLGNHKRLGFLVGLSALLVHPIMALPGLLLLLCLTFSLRTSVIGAIAGILATCLMAVAAVAVPAVARHISVIDPAWLAVVRERSEFLFLQLWPVRDLAFNARPFLCLAMTAAVLTETRARRLCLGALLVGGTGMLVALIGGAIGPIALLVQGQAWRWEWVTCLMAVLLLPQTIFSIWNDEKCGPVCSILLICSWMFPVLDGTLCALLALLLWLIRRHISALTGRHLRWAALACAAMILAWIAATSWNLLTTTPPDSGRESIALTKLRNVLGLGIPAAALVGLAWWWIVECRSTRALFGCSAVLVAGLGYAMPKSFEQIETLDSPAYLSEFADYRAAIPPTSTVFVAPAQDAGTLVWFALQRPHYLSPDQSAGVVFSRTTALEAKRRSEVLTPIESPNWRFLSAKLPGAATKTEAAKRKTPTAQELTAVCSDPVLGFVMSKDVVGVEPVLRKDQGKWRGWNLYDCQRIRPPMPVAP